MQHNKTRDFIEVIIHALFWVGVYYALLSLTASSINMVVYNNGQPTGGVNAKTLFPYALPVLGVLMLMFYGNILWLFKKVIRYKNNVWGVTAIAGWVVFLFVANYIVIRMPAHSSSGNPYHPEVAVPGHSEKMVFSVKGLPGSFTDSVHPPNIHVPSSPPPPPHLAFTTGDWWGMQLVMAIIFLAVLGIAVAYFFIKEWIRNDLARSQAEAQQFSTEVRFLRSQVNPHFLFNTLNNLFSMAQKNDDDAVAEGISKLSGMMRYMIYESNTDRVALQKEIDYLEDCVALNKLRYAGNEVTLTFRHPAPNGIASVSVAPMLFIPFLENAFKHGVVIGGNSAIDMAILVEGKTLTFTCENTDNSTVKKPAEEKAGIGLENIQRRLQLLYAGRHTLQVLRADGKYKVNLKIDIA